MKSFEENVTRKICTAQNMIQKEQEKIRELKKNLEQMTIKLFQLQGSLVTIREIKRLENQKKEKKTNELSNQKNDEKNMEENGN